MKETGQVQKFKQVLHQPSNYKVQTEEAENSTNNWNKKKYKDKHHFNIKTDFSNNRAHLIVKTLSGFIYTDSSLLRRKF